MINKLSILPLSPGGEDQGEGDSFLFTPLSNSLPRGARGSKNLLRFIQLPKLTILICLTLCIIMLYACASTPPVLTDNQYLDKANTLVKKKEYEAARELYEKIKDIYPDSPLMAQTRIGIADSYFYDEKYLEAIAGYEEMLKYHPLSKLAAKGQYQLADSYFKQKLTIDRDQENTQKAIAEFNKFTADYPKSELNEKAQQKILICRNTLADHELYVGRFYFKQKHYRTAIKRFQYCIINYPYMNAAEGAAYYLAESYLRLDKKTEARELFKLLLTRFPGGKYSNDAWERLAL